MNDTTVHQSNIPAMTTWIDQALAAYREAMRPMPAGDPRLFGVSDRVRGEVALYDDSIRRADVYWARHVAIQLPHPPIARPVWANEAELTAEACDDGYVLMQFRRDAEIGAATVGIEQFFSINLETEAVEEHPICIVLYVTDAGGRTTGVELDRAALPLVVASLQQVESVIGAQR